MGEDANIKMSGHVLMDSVVTYEGDIYKPKKNMRSIVKKDKIVISEDGKIVFPRLFESTLSETQSSLFAVGELATGLCATISNSLLSKSYMDSLTTQGALLKFASIFAEDLNIGKSRISEIMASIAPMSATIAEIGLASSNAARLFDIGSIPGEQHLKIQNISSVCLDAIRGQQSIVSSALDAINKSTPFAGSSLTESIRMINVGVNSVVTSLQSYPSDLALPSLKIIQEVGKITEDEIFKYERKLDAMLADIDPSLVEYRRGCWKAFRERGPDHIGQASSSMRRLFDNLLRCLAPDEDVKKTDYFINSTTGNGGKDKNGNPTRRARIFYILNYNKGGPEHLGRMADGLLKTCENLPAWDHVPLKKDVFVEGVFIAVEGYLISLLSERRK